MTHLPVCLWTSLPVCLWLSDDPSTCVPASQSTCVSVTRWWPIYLCVCVPVYLCVCDSVMTHLPVCLCTSLPVCLWLGDDPVKQWSHRQRVNADGQRDRMTTRFQHVNDVNTLTTSTCNIHQHQQPTSSAKQHLLTLEMCRLLLQTVQLDNKCNRVKTVALKMDHLKMTDKENWGTGIWRTGQWQTKYWVWKMTDCKMNVTVWKMTHWKTILLRSRNQCDKCRTKKKRNLQNGMCIKVCNAHYDACSYMKLQFLHAMSHSISIHSATFLVEITATTMASTTTTTTSSRPHLCRHLLKQLMPGQHSQ